MPTPIGVRELNELEKAEISGRSTNAGMALALLEPGMPRLGTSGGVAIVKGYREAQLS